MKIVKICPLHCDELIQDPKHSSYLKCPNEGCCYKEKRYTPTADINNRENLTQRRKNTNKHNYFKDL
jgi:hypothetical protein